MLKLVLGLTLGTIIFIPSISEAKSVILGPGSSQRVSITGINTPENTIEFTANNESYSVDDLFADSPEGTKLLAHFEKLIQSKEQVDIDYAVVQPDEKNQYSYKVALLIGTTRFGPATSGSNKVYYVFDKGKSVLKIDPLSDHRFAMINSNINLARNSIAKDAELRSRMEERTKVAEANKPVPQQPKMYPVPEFKFPYDIPSKAVLQALLYNLIGIGAPVELGSVKFKEVKTTNNYTRKFNDETVYIVDVSALVDIYPFDLNTNTLGNTPQQSNRSVQGEIPFIKRGSKWFAFNDFAKKWVELPGQ